MNGRKTNIEPEFDLAVEDEDQTLPLPEPEGTAAPPPLAAGRAAITQYLKHAPPTPGVYRMLDAAGDVLYVGKAKSIRKRIASYVRPTGHDTRIARMIAATASLEFVTTRTETEALLLEANLIKRLRPRFNVLMRDDKSFPYIVISRDHPASQILKHRGARTRAGDYYGPFASVWAVNRTITALQRAFLIRSCSDAVFESRTRPCLLHQIKRCSAPCTGEIAPDAYAELVREARDFLSGKSHAVKGLLADEMEKASQTMDFERAAIYRDRLAALSAIQSQQGVNLRGIEDADVFAIHQAGGYSCVQVFFFRTGQNWGNRAYFPKADRGVAAPEVLNAFIAQFYDDKPCPRTVLVSEELPERALLSEALSVKSGHAVEVTRPKRGEKRDVIDHALANAREALGRKLAETSSQQALLRSLAEQFGLVATPRRIEVYDNSHIQGANAVGAMIVAGPEGFVKNQYRKFNIRSDNLVPGDDTAMMREVLERRFKRLISEHPRVQHIPITSPLEASPSSPPPLRERSASEASREGGEPQILNVIPTPLPIPPPQGGREEFVAPAEQIRTTELVEAERADSPWPDLVLIDGGQGQLAAARETLTALGVTDLPLVAIAKGADRDAGRETFFTTGREPFRLPPRDPLLYFVERLRDEAHRFAIGSHRARRKRDIREGGLQEIPGIGPTRKRALLNHFGTLKAIERASLADLAKVPGINADSARRIYDFFHERPA